MRRGGFRAPPRRQGLDPSTSVTVPEESVLWAWIRTLLLALAGSRNACVLVWVDVTRVRVTRVCVGWIFGGGLVLAQLINYHYSELPLE